MTNTLTTLQSALDELQNAKECIDYYDIPSEKIDLDVVDKSITNLRTLIAAMEKNEPVFNTPSLEALGLQAPTPRAYAAALCKHWDAMWQKKLDAAVDAAKAECASHAQPALTDAEIDDLQEKFTLHDMQERSWYGDNYQQSCNDKFGARKFARALEQLLKKKNE